MGQSPLFMGKPWENHGKNHGNTMGKWCFIWKDPPFLMGKYPLFRLGHGFNSYVTNYQGVVLECLGRQGNYAATIPAGQQQSGPRQLQGALGLLPAILNTLGWFVHPHSWDHMMSPD